MLSWVVTFEFFYVSGKFLVMNQFRNEECEGPSRTTRGPLKLANMHLACRSSKVHAKGYQGILNVLKVLAKGLQGVLKILKAIFVK